MVEIVPFYDLGAIVRSNKELLSEAFDSVVDSGIFIGGDQVQEFEQSFSDFLGSSYFRGTGNGLDALRIGLEAIGVKPGDEVIVPGFSFYATWLAVIQVGAIPIFADVDLATGNLLPEEFGRLISPRTKAVIVVHLFGIPAAMDLIMNIANQNQILVVEDCAQSHGAIFNNQVVGTFGVIGAFSFYPTKNLGALGDAGGIATNDESIANIVASKRSYGQGNTKYDHIDLGWNSRIDPLQAAFLSVHLRKLNEWNSRRREISQYYLSQIPESQHLVMGSAEVDRSVWHHFVLRVSDRNFSKQWFAEQGISTDVHYPYSASSLEPLQKYFDSTNYVINENNSVKLSQSVLSFPIGPWMSDHQVEQVASSLKKFSSNAI